MPEPVRTYSAPDDLIATLLPSCLDGKHRCEIDSVQKTYVEEPECSGGQTTGCCTKGTGRTCRVIDMLVGEPLVTNANEYIYYYVVTAVREEGGQIEESAFSIENQGWPNYDDISPSSSLRFDPDNFPIIPCGDPVVSLDPDGSGIGSGQDGLEVAAYSRSETGDREETLDDATRAPYRAIGTWVGPSQPNADPRLIFYHLDHLGSPRVITDDAGNKVSEHHYMPFGEEAPVNPTTDSTNTRHFTGHERDGESGLDYMLARYYSSSLARFMAVDPGNDTYIAFPQTWNLYAYAHNNPLAYTDPTGTSAGVTVSQAAGLSGEHEIGGSNVGAAPGTGGAKSSIAARRTLAGQMARLPGKVRTAIPLLIKASNSPNADDHKGGLHEEGLVWGEGGDGKVVVSISKPGPAFSPGDAQVEFVFTPADVEQHARLTSIEGFLHVHPRGVGKITFQQSPTQQDIDNAKGIDAIHIVVGAYSKRVYFYDGVGTIGDVKLKGLTKGSK